MTTDGNSTSLTLSVKSVSNSLPFLGMADNVIWFQSKLLELGRKSPIWVTSPAGNVVHTMKGSAGDKFEFKAPKSGMFNFCFRNPHSSPETVSFYIHIGHITNEHDLAKDEHLDPISVKIAELREALESVTAEQNYLKARDSRHRHTNQSTRNRVIFYTVAEYLLLILASGLQAMYIRSLFTKSIGYNRI
ncbi:Transmembrane emp24 domain-containing protein p24beta3 [Capsicum annuum]|nr:Transmembrane emp24 domain-containing protein p24beta3 [Capsicum annuum]